MAPHEHREHERLHAVVHGDVQGVGFRYFVHARARDLDLAGWVRNNDDGTVEVVAEGPREALADLERAISRGPRMARVTHVEARRSEATGGLGPFDLAW